MEIKRSDVNSLETKLEKFAQDLPQQEQHVLSWILARAKAATEVSVSDADLDSVSGGLADAAALEEVDKVSVSGNVGWTR